MIVASRPAPIFRSLNQLGPESIPLDVLRHGDRMFAGLDMGTM
jgi:hypothetical protein